MPKKIIFYFVGFLLLVVAGIYSFNKWSEAKEKINLWTLIPEDAVFVLESADHAKLLEKLRQSDLWDNVSTVQPVASLTENINLLDSISGRNEGASRFLKRKIFLTSVHVVSKTDFDYVFYIPVNTVNEHRFVRSLVDNINKSNAFVQQTQSYQNHQIISITNQLNKEAFFYFTYHNNLIISANQGLVKEIIRNINRGQLVSPAQEYEAINYLEQPEVAAHVFINYRYLPSFLGIFLKEDLQPDINFLASLCRSSMLGLKLLKDKLLINGFSNPELLSDSFYNQVKTQTPQFFGMRKYLPNRTAMLLHMGVDQVASVKRKYPQDNNVTWPVPQIVLADSLTRTFKQELGIAYLETNKRNANTEKIILARSDNPGLTKNLLNNLIIQVSARNQVNSEKYKNYEIKAVPVNKFPLLLFGSVARGFEQCFVTQVDEYTLFASSAATLRNVLDDIISGRIWSETQAQKALLEHTQQEANLSIYLNANLAWNMLNRHVREEDRSNLLRHEVLFKKLSQIALQFSQKDNQYYTSLVLNQPEEGALISEPKMAFEAQSQIAFDSRLISSALPVQPVNAPGSDIFVQDSAFALHRVNADGQIIWTDSLNKPVVGAIHRATFGRDKAAKFLFATGNNIHCLDQNGRSLENFPFILPDSIQIAHFAVFNLSQSPDYRLLVTDNAGRMFMFDQVGNLQNNWSPKVLEAPLASAPQVFSINRSDVILVVRLDGYVYAYNPQGSLYPGFPIDLKTDLAAGVFTHVNSTLRNSQVTIVSQAGQKITFNLTGKVLNRGQLPQLSRRSVFELIPDPENKSYVITRQEPGKINLYDQNHKLLLERNFITSSRKLVQYFDFGPLDRIYALTETGPRKTYLYNYQAKLIGQKPLNNSMPVSIRFNNNTQIYSLQLAAGKELQRIIFRDE